MISDPKTTAHAAAVGAIDRTNPVTTREAFERAPARDVRARLDSAIAAAQRCLLAEQKPDGHWCAELEGDTILESEYVLLLYFLGQGHTPRVQRLCNYLRSRQLAEGGWATFPGGPPDPNPSVKAYFALKLAGDGSDAPHMRRARESILRLGGVEACNSFTKIYLSIFGQYAWRDAPGVPPELIRMPLWFPINIWEMSSWSRAIVVPLSILWALKPSCPVPPGRGILELHGAGSTSSWYRAKTRSHRAWAFLFRGVDRAVKIAEALGLFRPWRQGSIERCQAFVEERLEGSAGLAAIFPSILNVVMAYRALGYPLDHPVVKSQLRELEKLELGDGDTLRVQPCCSPVWDTALTLGSLLESGLDPRDPVVSRAVLWLLDHEVKRPGDWRIKNPDGPVGGFYFEYANEPYPDCDDTAEMLALFGGLDLADKGLEQRKVAATERALQWQLSMQNRDGGWGAFDRECNRFLLTLIPFADHNAMIDPSTADVSARTVEGLKAAGLDPRSAPIRRAIKFLCREQEADGSWYGRWGANYLYGTWLALSALGAVGQRAFGRNPAIASRRGVEWLLSCQNHDGGWGETLRSYDDASLKGRGASTASQTAWAMMGLLNAGAAADDGDSPLRHRAAAALGRAADYLLSTQLEDGSWWDETWTGTGFPSVFYLRYHSYAKYFPLQALAQYRSSFSSRTLPTS